MFNYYKKIFMLTLKSEFCAEALSITDTSFDGNSSSDLKALKLAIKDGNIDSKEAKIIKDHIDDIEGEAKNGLNEIAKNMLTNGFSAINETVYNSFKKIIENDGTTKIPEWSSIKDKLETIGGSSYSFDSSNFHGVQIVGNEINVRYDGSGMENTLHLKYFGKNVDYVEGSNSYGIKWSSESDDDTDFKQKSEVDLNILDDNINSIQEHLDLKVNTQSTAPKTSKQPTIQKQSVEKKKETAEGWIIRKYDTKQIGKLKSAFGLEENASNSDLVKAVKEFQKENGLTIDGKPGTNTIKMISKSEQETESKKQQKAAEKTEKPLDISKMTPEDITTKLESYTLATKLPLKSLTPEQQKVLLIAIKNKTDLPIREGTVTMNNMKSNRKVIGTIDLPAINGDATGVYDENQISSSLINQKENIVIKSGIVTGIPDSINEEGYYKVEKAQETAQETVVVTGERLKKMFKIENKADKVFEKKELNIDDLGIDFSKLDINVKKENIRIEGGKYIIDIDGVGYNLTLEPIDNGKFKITDNSDNISDIIISKGEIVEATLLLNKLVQEKFMHKAYDKSHKLGGNLTSEGRHIKGLINSVRSPSNLAEFKIKIANLKEEVFPKKEEKK